MTTGSKGFLSSLQKLVLKIPASTEYNIGLPLTCRFPLEWIKYKHKHAQETKETVCNMQVLILKVI